ncbi:hypothetical protein BAY59_22755 [Prauserella coralliicola]|nr:hypothetical protein BAY59_22755 [Prauserella coralliicola]
MTVGAQLRQVCRLGATSTPERLLIAVGLADTGRIMKAKPYQLSGGQRQRVLIALALAREPALIVADEPTTALDVTVQAQVVRLLRELQEERRFALMFVSHDLALVSEFAEKIVVMYAGQVVETGPTVEVLSRPRHPYTAGLVAASASVESREETLSSIPGVVRQPGEYPSGCRFMDRCWKAKGICNEKPNLEQEAERSVACFYPVS